MVTMIKNFFYFTATVLNWKHILKADKYKDVLIESFRFLVNKERVRIFAFVIRAVVGVPKKFDDNFFK